MTAERAGMERAALERTIEEWISRRPLRYLRAARRPGLLSLLAFLDARGIAAGVFSDYPVASKLEALGVAQRFSVALAATDPEINAFKPHPRGFLRACELLRLAPEEVLYVGDRADTDHAGAVAAGLASVVLGRRAPAGVPRVPSLFALARRLAFRA
jgi:HAD superfamily hydrolase (TIGR01549 family)